MAARVRRGTYLEVEGIAEVKQLLSGYTASEAKNAARRLFAGFAADVRNDMRAVVNVRTGGTKGAIKSAGTKSGGAKVFAKRPEGAAAHIIRKGTGQRSTKGGASRGSMPANSRMQAILDGAPSRFQREVVPRVAADLKKQALRTLARAAKGGRIK